MKQVDYIIVGGGFAGFFLAHQFLLSNNSFLIYSAGQVSASHISAGICNPVILKRFTTFWKSAEQMDYLETIFAEIAAYTGKNYIVKEPVARIFHDDAEKKQWLRNAEKDNLKPFLDPNFVQLKTVENPLESGIVKDSCRIDVENFFQDMTSYFTAANQFVSESFDYNAIDAENSTYKNIKYKHIIFCEGVAVRDNPYFDKIPVLPNKGHCLEIKIDQSIDPYIIKKKHFLFSLAENRFYYGGTYDRFSTTPEIQLQSVEELENGLKSFYKGNYKITKVKAAFRATVADRRPILGTHIDIKNFHIFNGLGARGVLNGSYFSKQMFDYLEHQVRLDPEIDVKRFY